MVRVGSLTSGFDHDLHYLISDSVQTHQVLSTPTRTTPSEPRATTGRHLEAADLARVAGIMLRVCKYMRHHCTLLETYHLSSSRTVESRPREDQQSSVVDRASSSQAYGRHHYRRCVTLAARHGLTATARSRTPTRRRQNAGGDHEGGAGFATESNPPPPTTRSAGNR